MPPAELSSRAFGKVDAELQGVDALCSLWARELWDWAKRDVNPIYRGMREREGAAAPGRPPQVSDAAMLLDRILGSADPRYRDLVVIWYVGGDPIVIKAKRLGTNRTELYARWRRVLEYLRGRLHSAGIDI